jgi:hypothetical protein
MDGLIFRVNGKTIEDFNRYADELRKRVNELISKMFSKSLESGLQQLAIAFEKNGLDPSLMSTFEKSRINGIISDALPDIIHSSIESINFLTEASIFVKEDCTSIEGEKFRAPLFNRFIILVLIAFIAYSVPAGPFYIIKGLFLVIFIVIFINGIFYIPRRLKYNKKQMKDEEQHLKDDFDRIFHNI